MRGVFFTALIGFLASCTGRPSSDKVMQQQLDSMSATIRALKPGLGEYMLSVQLHHNKLWFAGNAKDWDLAGFEIDEIKEQLEHATSNCTDRPEIKALPVITPYIDSLSACVKAKDADKFRTQFTAMTQACNDCHRSVHFDFIRIRVPDQPMFSNQEW
jgi:uncharacterized repeat protein (TIGR04076 family)